LEVFDDFSTAQRLNLFGPLSAFQLSPLNRLTAQLAELERH